MPSRAGRRRLRSRRRRTPATTTAPAPRLTSSPTTPPTIAAVGLPPLESRRLSGSRAARARPAYARERRDQRARARHDPRRQQQLERHNDQLEQPARRRKALRHLDTCRQRARGVRRYPAGAGRAGGRRPVVRGTVLTQEYGWAGPGALRFERGLRSFAPAAVAPRGNESSAFNLVPQRPRHFRQHQHRRAAVHRRRPRLCREPAYGPRRLGRHESRSAKRAGPCRLSLNSHAYGDSLTRAHRQRAHYCRRLQPSRDDRCCRRSRSR